MNPSAVLLAARVPRYTSYPTAPHFHVGVGSNTYGKWLEELPAEANLSLYLHIPFCDTLCWFCGCHTKVVNRYSPVADYLGWLTAEIELVARRLGARRRVTHIHWGGGSPTLLAPPDVLALSETLRHHFDVSPDAEFAVEIDPRGLSVEVVEALARSGVTRASIGVQDCDPDVQRAINRIQPFSSTRHAVDRLRSAGIEAINIDLIYGLPLQTVEKVERTVNSVLSLNPQRLAAFGYAHVPSFKKHQALIRDADLPGPEERLRQFESIRSKLEAANFELVGLDHFAQRDDPLATAKRAGTLKRNFQGYTTDAAPALIGIGASSISSMPQGYAQNTADVRDWRRAVSNGQLPVARGIALTGEDRVRRAIIERLMCSLEADVGAICAENAFPFAAFATEMVAMHRLAAEDLIELEGTRVRVAPQCAAFVRIVAAQLDAYLSAGKAIHAAAV